jgi:hypothetical protein
MKLKKKKTYLTIEYTFYVFFSSRYILDLSSIKRKRKVTCNRATYREDASLLSVIINNEHRSALLEE